VACPLAEVARVTPDEPVADVLPRLLPRLRRRLGAAVNPGRFRLGAHVTNSYLTSGEGIPASTYPDGRSGSGLGASPRVHGGRPEAGARGARR